MSTLLVADVQAAPTVSCSPSCANASMITMTGTAASGAGFSVVGEATGRREQRAPVRPPSGASAARSLIFALVFITCLGFMALVSLNVAELVVP